MTQTDAQTTQALTDGAGRPYEPTKLTWFDIYVDDPAAAKPFYASVFGWTFQPFYEGCEACFDATGAMVCSLNSTDATKAEGRHGFRTYFDLEDLEAVLDRIVPAGGRIALPRTKISDEFGWYAEVLDPCGVTVGLCTSNDVAANRRVDGD